MGHHWERVDPEDNGISLAWFVRCDRNQWIRETPVTNAENNQFQNKRVYRRYPVIELSNVLLYVNIRIAPWIRLLISNEHTKNNVKNASWHLSYASSFPIFLIVFYYSSMHRVYCSNAIQYSWCKRKDDIEHAYRNADICNGIWTKLNRFQDPDSFSMCSVVVGKRFYCRTCGDPV